MVALYGKVFCSEGKKGSFKISLPVFWLILLNLNEDWQISELFYFIVFVALGQLPL